MQEPLPSVNKNYVMLQIVESQRVVHKSFQNSLEKSVMMAKTWGGEKLQKEKESREEGGEICDHC